MIGGVFADFATAGSHVGSIHSVFDRVVNIEFAGLSTFDTMLSIGAADVPITSALLVVHTEPGFSWLQQGIRAGNSVTVKGGVIHIGNFLISMGQATLWRPERRLFEGGCDARRINEIIKALPGHHTTAMQRLNAALLGGAPIRSDAMECALWEGVVKLKKYLHGIGEPHEAVGSLAGLGDGLTPTGDDVLAGALYGLFCLNSLERARPLADAVKHAMKATNRISRHFLAYAAEGIWGKREQSFLFSLFQPDSEDYVKQAIAFAEVGASSGIDQMLGMLLSLQAGGEACL